MTELLVVDLCGTLVRENTTHGFLRIAPLQGFAGLRRTFLLSNTGLAAGNWISGLQHRCRLVGCLHGVPREVLQTYALTYARATLTANSRRWIERRIRNAPDRTVLASASLDIVVAAFAELLDVRFWVGSELGYDTNGRCTGLITRDATGCKLQLLETRLGRPLRGFSLITDNPEDTDLMATAGLVDFIRPGNDD